MRHRRSNFRPRTFTSELALILPVHTGKIALLLGVAVAVSPLLKLTFPRKEGRIGSLRLAGEQRPLMVVSPKNAPGNPPSPALIQSAPERKDSLECPLPCKKTVTATSTQFEFAAAGLFEVGSAVLTPAAEAAFNAWVPALREMARSHSVQIQIESDTDSSPVRRFRKVYPTNWELSGGRSFSVVRLFEAAGIPSSQLQGTGFGSSRSSPSSAAKNRRLTIRIANPPLPYERGHASTQTH